MATLSNHARFIAQDENLEVRHKKAAFVGKNNASKGAAKKGRDGIGERKPLGDLTNKRDVLAGVTTKKPTVPQDKFNIAEECFLHDHNKCVQANNAALRLSIEDVVLPKCSLLKAPSRLASSKGACPHLDFLDPALSRIHLDVVFPERKVPMQEKVDLDSPTFPEEMEIPDLSDLDSPPPLHLRPESPPPSPFALPFETVQFELKDEN